MANSILTAQFSRELSDVRPTSSVSLSPLSMKIVVGDVLLLSTKRLLPIPEDVKDWFSEWKRYNPTKQNKLFYYCKDSFCKGKRRHFEKQNNLFYYE